MKRMHGGDWAGYETEYGKEAIDFSMNVNPLGVPEDVAKAIASAASKADRYPDPECRRLRDALAEHEGIPADRIFCGNGAADIIDRIALAMDPEGRTGRALVTSPTFSEYEQALTRCGWIVDHIGLDDKDGFRITDGLADDMVARDCDMIFLCEPNNPTGVTTEKSVLKRIADGCERSGTILVVDECFNGFLDEPDAHTMKKYLEDHPGIVILKAFTKIYGMAGVRLGYCLCSDGEKLGSIQGAGQPWNVSYLAEEAGLAALREDDYLKRTRDLIRRERSWLREQLASLAIEEIFGEANYLLFRWPPEANADAGAEGTKLSDDLRRRGILIRDCSNFSGLEEGWYRIAVRTHEENERLIETLRELCK